MSQSNPFVIKVRTIEPKRFIIKATTTEPIKFIIKATIILSSIDIKYNKVKVHCPINKPHCAWQMWLVPRKC